MRINTKNTLSALSLLLLSTSVLAAQCEKTKPDNSDDFNLHLTSTGLEHNSHVLIGNPVQLKASSSWLHIGMKDSSSLNAQLYLNGVIAGSHTAPIGSTSPTISRTYTSLPLGMHTAEARSKTDTNCISQGTFVVQSAPNANANGNYSVVIGSTSGSSTATVNLNGTSSTDTVNSINKLSPNLKWKVNGTTYDGNSVSVDLPHGTYTAKFTVNDGTFIDSDTATISVIDQLNISRVYSEAICPGGLGRMIIDWNRNPHASYYEMERKITNSSWSSEGTTTGTNNLLRTSSGPTRVVERFRVRACSNSKCGSWATETYYTPDCGNFMPN